MFYLFLRFKETWSRLDTDGFGCHFANGKCELWFDNNYIGDAFLYNDLYLLSMRDKVHSVCDVNVNESLLEKETLEMLSFTKITQDTSSKLWHCRLGHISRGRIERLVKSEILP